MTAPNSPNTVNNTGNNPNNNANDPNNPVDSGATPAIDATDAAEEATKDVANKVAKDVAKQVAKEVANAVVKNAVKKAMKEVDIKEKFPPASSRLQQMSQPSMISYINLYNNHRENLKPEKVLRLKEKITDMQKYSQVISDDFKILIVDKSNGIDRNKAEQLRMQIMETLENYIPAKPGEVPIFLDASYVSQSLKIVCADEFTVTWLKAQIDTYKKNPPWKGLAVKRMSSYIGLLNKSKKQAIPKPKPLELQVKFLIPSNVKKAEFDEVKKRIEIRNPPIKTENWTKLLEEDTPKGTMYYASIPNDSMKLIKNKDNRLFYMLGTVTVVLLRDAEISACMKKIEEISVAAKKAEMVSQNATDANTGGRASTSGGANTGGGANAGASP